MYATRTPDGLLMIAVNYDMIVNRLLEVGYEFMSFDEKNQLIIAIANKENVLLNEMTDEYILNYHKYLKISKINSKCESSIEDGFISSNGHTYRTNRDDQINMIGQKDIVIGDESIATIMWKAEDVGSWIEHTREEWLTMYKEAFVHKQNQLVKYNKLKQQIMNAKTHDEILSINW